MIWSNKYAQIIRYDFKITSIFLELFGLIDPRQVVLPTFRHPRAISHDIMLIPHDSQSLLGYED